MPFSIQQTPGTLFPVITLEDSDSHCAAEIYSYGALLNAFRIATPGGQHNMIDGFDSPRDAIDNMLQGFKSAKLSPFVCRLGKGIYHVEGKTYTINKFYLGEEAIHGLIFDAIFTVTDAGATNDHAFVHLQYDYASDTEGFPFPYRTEVIYRLYTGGRLTLDTIVTNTGNQQLLLSDGWHPYFTLGETVNNLQVQMNTNTMVDFDDRLLPTGTYTPYTSFSTMKPFGETVLDNCFVLNNFDQPSCILYDPGTGIQLTVQAGNTYPYLQVYTPPHRKSIAIENLSSPPDAFNNGIGLLTVTPGGKVSFATTYKAVYKAGK